jgi:hypothetical protein
MVFINIKAPIGSDQNRKSDPNHIISVLPENVSSDHRKIISLGAIDDVSSFHNIS